MENSQNYLSEENPSSGYTPNRQPGFFKRAFDSVWEIVKIIVISLIIIVPIRMFVMQPFIVDGDSMVPNFHNGEYLIVDELSYRFSEPKRGQVVIFHPPKQNGQPSRTYYIKRIIGLPGETIELKDGSIYIHNEEFPKGQLLNEEDYLTKSRITQSSKVTLGQNEYFVLGDNRDNSLDSRIIGPINLSSIKGKVFLRAFPFNQFTIFDSPDYKDLSLLTYAQERS